MSASMTARQRLLAALRREPTDCVPVSPRIGAYLITEGLDPLAAAAKFGFDPYCECIGMATPLSSIRCQRVALPRVKVEVAEEREGEKRLVRRVFHTPAGPLRDELIWPDAGPVYGPSPNPEWREPLVKTREDAERFRYLLPDPAAVDVDRFRRYETEWGERGLVTARPCAGTDDIAILALEVSRAMVLLHDDRPLFDRMFAIVDDWHVAIMRRMLAAGARVVFDAFYHMSLSTGWSPQTWREVVFPIVRRHAEIVHAAGGLLVYYDDGKIMNSVAMAVAAGVDAIQTLTPPPVGDADFAALKRLYGSRVCFWGGVDLIRMKFGTADEVACLTRAALAALAPGGGYILGTSDSIREGTPAENIHAFCRTGRAWRG